MADRAVRARPILRWHGGKFKSAKRILALLPPHRVYVEPFAGAASILLRKERSYAEVYNDLDGEVVNLFRVVRDPEAAARLTRALELTPFARAEFEAAYGPAAVDPVERARRTIIKSFMGFGSNAIVGANGHDRKNTGFRGTSNRSGTTPAHDWRHYPQHVTRFCERLQGVVIDQRDAAAVILAHDGPGTLHYVDPPYPHATRASVVARSDKRFYRHEMTDADHIALLELLEGLRGMVVLSTYDSPMYDRLQVTGWERHAFQAMADGARARTEVVWLNPAAWRARAAGR